MRLLDRIRELWNGDDGGGTRSDSEDLLALSGASLTMVDRLGYEPAGEAALCFAASGEVDATVEELQSVIAGASENDPSATRVRTDGHGYRWLVVEDETIEGLATALQFTTETFFERGYAGDLLAAVFAFEGGDVAYWIYSFERGRFYPFVPTGADERDNAEEFKLRSVLAGELPIEEDESEWYPLWPDSPGQHPWE